MVPASDLKPMENSSGKRLINLNGYIICYP